MSVLPGLLVLALSSLQAPPVAAPQGEAATPATVAPVATDTATPEPAPNAFAVLDDGLLQEAWFGQSVPFTHTKDIDFIWVKPGFNLAGRQVQVRSWEKPVLLVEKRDEKDRKTAGELTYQLPLILRNTLHAAFGNRLTLSSTAGDFVLTGRLVDVNAGNQAVKLFLWMGAGSGTATWDLKLVDAKTQELVLAVHHRCVSGSAFTEVQDKVEKWSKRFAQYLSETAIH